jgi:hypothetical protein
MEKQQKSKIHKWNFWGMVIVAALGAYSTIMSTVLNNTAAKEDNVNVIVEQINDKVLPQLQVVIENLTTQNASLRERVSFLEGKIEGFFPPFISEESKKEEKKKEKRKIKPKKKKIEFVIPRIRQMKR